LLCREQTLSIIAGKDACRVLEPPTLELQQRLRDWRLCRPADLRRARRRVRQLARDLPAFDSVWIDALVQDGRLTPFQARVLESDRPESLVAGDYVLLDELGRSRVSRTWLARSLSTGRTAVVKRVVAAPERRAEVATRGRRLAASSLGQTVSALISPTICWDDATGCYFVMPPVAGTPLSELLVRRGRFPAEIVAEIGYQLAAALADWHRAGQVHGDIRLSHVRITPRGQVVLVEAGLRPVIEPDITLYTSMSLEAYDGIAPELIGIGHPPTAAADLYALGCLVWQLLAGRPPFTTADPLAKLAAHQTRTIRDVREWAPETPTGLAELIAELTTRDPEQRPRSADEVAQRLFHLGTPGRGAVRAFRRQFDVSVPHLRPRPSTTLPWLTVIVTLFALGGLIASLADKNVRRELLSLTGNAPQVVTKPAEPAIDATSGLLPLPTPTADGLITLDQPGPYSVGSLRHAGPLRIQAPSGVCPVIVVRDQPLRIAAERVTIDGVTIRHDLLWHSTERPAAMVEVQTQQLSIAATEFNTGVPQRGRNSMPAAVSWTLIDELDPTAGELHVSHSVFRGAGTGIIAASAARHVTADDVLWHGRGTALEFRTYEDDPPIQLNLSHVTQRDGRVLVQLALPASSSPRARLIVTATDCVFGLHGSLLEFAGDDAPVLGTDTVVWTGDGSLIPSELPIATWRADATGPITVLPTDDWPLEGLTAGRFAFAGPSGDRVADAVLAEAEAPRRSADPPGLRLHKFTACHGGVTEPLISLPPDTFNRGP
jgi:serine/threonine protein kinase